MRQLLNVTLACSLLLTSIPLFRAQADDTSEAEAETQSVDPGFMLVWDQGKQVWIAKMDLGIEPDGNFETELEVSKDILEAAQQASHIASTINSADDALRVYRRLNTVFNLVMTPEYFNLNMAKLPEAESKAIVKELWNFIIQIDAALKTLGTDIEKLSDQDKATLYKTANDLVMNATYLLEMVIENTQNVSFKSEGSKRLFGFEGIKGLNYLVNEKYGEEYEPKSGDVILVAGLTFNSAAIGRVGHLDSFYSHQAMVYVDDSGKKWIMEAVVDKGVVVYPYEDFLKHHQGAKLMSFRFADASMASKAAKTVYDAVNGKNLPYNFSMELSCDLNKGLFCSQLVWWGYMKASDGKIDINTIPSVLSPNYKKFLAPIGVTADVTYSPGGALLSKYFEPVAIWGDPNLSRQLRWRWLILLKLFEWLDKYDFPFQSTRFEKAIGNVIHFLRTSWIGGYLPGIRAAPANQSGDSIATVITLQRAGAVFFKHIENIFIERSKAGLSDLAPQDVLEIMESIRLNRLPNLFAKWLPPEVLAKHKAIVCSETLTKFQKRRLGVK